MPTSTSSPPLPTSPVSARSASGSHQQDGPSPHDHQATPSPVVAHTLSQRPDAAKAPAATPETTLANGRQPINPAPSPTPFDTSHLGGDLEVEVHALGEVGHR